MFLDRSQASAMALSLTGISLAASVNALSRPTRSVKSCNADGIKEGGRKCN
jgi:hypothetical protein